MRLEPSPTADAQPLGRDAFEIEDLITRQPPRHSLLPGFYSSPDIYRLDMDRVLLPHWHCVGHESSLLEMGEYLLFDYDRDSVIVVRGRDGKVRALANACRHRGSRLCDAAGKAKGGVLVCPYHAWAYALDGRLQHARMMPPTFDRSRYGLRELPFRIIQGLMFVSLADEPLALNEVEESLNGALGPHGWADAKVAHEMKVIFDANWKLAIENQVECYHCGPAHPEFSVVHGQSSAHEGRLTACVISRATEQGIHIATRDQWALKARQGEEADYANRYPLREGAKTASRNGTPLAPLMGRFTDYDGGHTLAYVGPMNHFLAYGDYGAIFRYTPRSPTTTELVVTWLVRGDATEGVDYDVEALTWMWTVTAAADKKIVEENQRGVDSRFYRPGPYALPIEEKTFRFTEWYLSALREAATGATDRARPSD